MLTNKAEIIEIVKQSLEELRPYLHEDGGDMELVDVTDEGIVQVKLMGACSDCSMSTMTIKAGLEEAVKRVAPEVVAVEAV
jgi:Fe-S cluster biogenesis protein NfuA